MLEYRMEDSFTFDDVLLLSGCSKVPPGEVSVKSKITQTLECNIPLLNSAKLDTVTKHKLLSAYHRKGTRYHSQKHECRRAGVTSLCGQAIRERYDL